MGPADGARLGRRTACRSGRVHPVGTVAVDEGRGEIGSGSGRPRHVGAIERPGAPPAQGEVGLDGHPADDDQVVRDRGRGNVVAPQVLEEPEPLARLGIEALDAPGRADDDLAGVRGERRRAPGDARFPIRLPQRLAGGRIDGQQVGIGPARQQNHHGLVGQQHGIADPVVSADRTVLGAQLAISSGAGRVQCPCSRSSSKAPLPSRPGIRVTCPAPRSTA